MALIEIGNLYSRLTGDIPTVVLDAIADELSYELKDAKFQIEAINRKRMRDSVKNGTPYVPTSWDGKVKLFHASKNMFYTGMLTPIVRILKANNIPIQTIDQRGRPEANDPEMKLVLPPGKTERPYQNTTVDIAYNAGRGIIQAATGSGKTLIITKLIDRIKTVPFLFFTLTEDLMDQAYETLSICLNRPIGRVGAGHCDIQPVSVCMIQTAIRALNRNNKAFKLDNYKYDDEEVWDGDEDIAQKNGAAIEELIRSAKGVYIDECHHAAADTVKEVLMAARNAYWRFGGSATPFREDGQEKMLQALFARRLVNISASWLIQRGWLVRPYILNVYFEDGKAGEFMSYQKIYKECIVNNERLHDFTASMIKHFVSRGITTLGLVKEYPHGEALQSRLEGVPFLRGDNAKKLRRDTIAGLRDGTITAAIGTTLADEGLDVPRLGAAVVAGGGRSITRVFQRVGRPMRVFPGKKCGFTVLIHHDGRFLNEHGKRVRRILKTEPEFVIRNCNVNTAIGEIDRILDEQGQQSLFDGV